MIFLKKFRVGWQIRFNAILEELVNRIPDIMLVSEERAYGMLRLKFKGTTDATEYIANAVAYKIERESSKTCEVCGAYGKRREELLPEKMCLCWKCYALEVNAIVSNNTQT